MSGERGVPQLGDAPFVDHFAPAVLAAVAENNLVALRNSRSGTHRRVPQLHPIALDHVAAFPALQDKMPVAFEIQGRAGARHDFPGHLGFRALVAARDVGAL